ADADAARLVEGNDVAGEGGRAADGGRRGARGDGHALAHVGDHGAAGGIGADEVALDQVVRRPRAADEEAVGTVAGEEVARTGGRAADGVRRRTVEDVDAVGPVGEGGGAGRVGADAVARHRVVRGPRALDDDAVGTVAGDDIARGGGRAADGVRR